MAEDVQPIEDNYFSKFEWGYGKTNGPHAWHMLRECESIRHPLWGQSPINIVTKACVDDLHYYQADAQYDFRPASVVHIENTGRTWQILYSLPDLTNPHEWSYSDGTLRSLYSLCNIHMHWGDDDSHGSEHYIDGRDFSAEVHFVYFNQDYYDSYEEAINHEGGILIQAVLFELGESGDKGLDTVIDLLSHIPYKGQKHILDKFDPFNILPNKTREDMYSIYHYYGSLCQPPCTESATWNIFKKTKTISKSQLDKLRRLHTHTEGGQPVDGEPFIKDNRRVKSLSGVFPLDVKNASIEYPPSEQGGLETPQKQRWEGTNYREVVSSEPEKSWMRPGDKHGECVGEEHTITALARELVKPKRKDCSHFNCQFKDTKVNGSAFAVYTN